MAALLAITACTAHPAPEPGGTGTSPAATPTTTAPPTDPGGAITLTVMSYNVLGGVPPNSWFPLIPPAELDPMAREPGTVAKIRHVNPDLIGFQEYRPEGPSGQRLADDLADYSWILPDNPTKETVAVPLLYKPTRFDRIDSGFERITDPEDGCSGNMERYAAWAKLRDKKTGRTLAAINVHTCPYQTDASAAIRSASIDRIVALVGRLDPGLADPLVLTGDFNAHSDETRPVYRDHLTKLAAAGLADTATTAKKDTSDVPRAGSYNGMQSSVKGKEHAKVVRRTNRHMDYIWVPKKTKVATWATVSGPGLAWRTIEGVKNIPVWTGIIPSDHSPVVAKITFAAGKAK